MELDLTSWQYLNRFELTLLVTGMLALWREDRYMPVSIFAHREVAQQIRLLLRWSNHWEIRADGTAVAVPTIIDLMEVPIK